MNSSRFLNPSALERIRTRIFGTTTIERAIEETVTEDRVKADAEPKKRRDLLRDIKEFVARPEMIMLKAMTIPIVAIGITAWVYLPRSIKDTRLTNEMKKIADYDKNGLTTYKEWEEAYDELGLRYQGGEGRDLPKDDRMEFIQRHDADFYIKK